MNSLPIHVVAISGPPGSGTTTAARILSQQTGLIYRNTGAIFREMAQERGMSLADFGQFVAENPDVDRELDARQLAYAQAGNVILEGRLAGFVVKSQPLAALAVHVDAPLEVRVQRLSNRDGLDLEQALKTNALREELERKRYLDVYGYDLNRLDIYDLVLDSSQLSPQQIVDRILSALRQENPHD